VLAFLQAEIDSPKPELRQQYVRCLQVLGLDRASLVDAGDRGIFGATRRRPPVDLRFSTFPPWPRSNSRGARDGRAQGNGFGRLAAS